MCCSVLQWTRAECEHGTKGNIYACVYDEYMPIHIHIFWRLCSLAWDSLFPSLSSALFLSLSFPSSAVSLFFFYSFLLSGSLRKKVNYVSHKFLSGGRRCYLVHRPLSRIPWVHKIAPSDINGGTWCYFSRRWRYLW